MERDKLRQVYFDAWRKHRQGLPLPALEQMVTDVITIHPEYHELFDDSGTHIDADGQDNPFLHLGLHLAVREQVATDRPAGIAAAFRRLAQRSGGSHEAEHLALECLAECLWRAQKLRLPPDEKAYLQKISALAEL